MEDEQIRIEIAPMRAENQRMKEALEKILAYEPKVGEKGNLTAHSLKLIAKMGLGRRF